MQKKIVLLDLGGVVFESSGISNDRINWSVINQLNAKYGHDLNVGKDLFPSFLVEYNALTQQELDGATFLREIFDTLHFNKDLIDLLCDAYRIIIVSDNYRENIAYISQRFHFSDWAEQQFYSFDFELEKADRAFFERLLKELNVAARDLLYIDDSPHKIAAAAHFGIRGIIYENNEQIKTIIEQ